MSEVSSKAFILIFGGLERKGLPASTVLEGLGHSAEELLDPGHRTPWDVYAEIAERFENAVGGEREAERLAIEFVDNPRYRPLRKWAGLVADCSALYKLVQKSVGTSMFSVVRPGFRELTDGKLELTLTIPEPYRPSAPFLRICGATYSHLPVMIGLPQAQVEMEISPRFARYVITPPRSRTLTARVGLAFRALTGGAMALSDELSARHAELLKSHGTLKQSETEFKEILGKLPTAVVVQAGERMEYGNSAWKNSMGFAADEDFVGRKLADFELGPIGARAVFRRKDGTQVLFEVGTERPLRFGGKEAILLAMTDITEREKNERKIREQQTIIDNFSQLAALNRLAAIGQMAGGIAHEIKNPLTSILLNTELLQRLEPAQASLARVEEIRAASSRIVTIIDGLIKYSGQRERRESLTNEPVASLVEAATALLRVRFEKAQVQLEISVVPPDARVTCRKEHIAEALVNLLNNAYDATAQLPIGRQRRVRVEAHAHETSVAFAVIDSGEGVPANIRDRIMEPFFTTKPGNLGTGLGLSIARGIAEAHDGKLELEAASQETRFVMSLPRDGKNS